MGDDRDRPSVKKSEPSYNRAVIAKSPVSMEFRKILKDKFDVVQRVRPGGMARQLNILPRTFSPRGHLNFVLKLINFVRYLNSRFLSELRELN